MKRAAAITLLCLGAGAVGVGAAFEEPCTPNSQGANLDAATPAATTPPRSCRSGGHGYHGGGSFFSRVVRGGFGAFGRAFGG
jgi:hypothetical protein